MLNDFKGVIYPESGKWNHGLATFHQFKGLPDIQPIRIGRMTMPSRGDTCD